MDWQIRIALIIIGIGVVGFIFYDFNRRKKAQQQKQRLIDQMRSTADQIDGQGFDLTGVGNVRKASDIAEQKISGVTPTQTDVKITLNDKKVQQNPTDSVLTDEAANHPEVELVSVSTKPAPTEQLDLVNIDENDTINFEPDLVFSLILRAPEGDTFRGSDFLPILLSQGLRHGDMGIFHRHLSQPKGKKTSVMYSVANAIKPGTFDIKNIQTFETPAFAFFMTVPGPDEPLVAYEGMVKTIQLLKTELGGQILDETKSVFTEQTYQHQKEQLQNHMVKASIKR